MILLKNIKQIIYNSNVLYVIYIIYSILFVNNIKISGDDLFYIKQSSTISFAVERYFNWSSRVLIDLAIPFFCKNLVIFKLITLLLILIIPFLISKILTIEKSKISFVYGIFLLYNFNNMGSAGWVATLTNYYYPLFFLILSFYLIKYINNNYFFAILILVSILCGTQEQTCLIYFCVIAYFSYKNFHSNKRYLVIFFIVLLCLIFISISPGNINRYFKEINTWFPLFNTYNVFDKIFLGLISTFNYYFLTINPIIIFLLICIFINKYRLKHVLTLSTLLIIFAFFNQLIFGNDVSVNGENFIYIRELDVYREFVKLFYFLVESIIVIYIFINTAIYFEDKNISLVAISAFILGFISRFLIGFSPTVFASSYRTFIFCDYALIILSVLFFLKSKIENKIIIIYLCLLIKYLNN